MQAPADDPGTAGDAARGRRRTLTWAIAPVLLFAALAAVFALALTTGDPSRLPSALIGKPVPATQFPALQGLADAGRPVPGFSSADLAKGTVSVVNFWASWCTECADEQALLLELRERTGVVLYGVNYKDQPAAARRFLGRFGNPFTAAGTDDTGRGAIEWGVYGMPETFVVNGRGEIAFKHVGAITPRSLNDKLIPAIEAARRTLAGKE
jgi:cytochrome c biogenesis protein CcmG/thiol:disulfide interchange protein DsbE